VSPYCGRSRERRGGYVPGGRKNEQRFRARRRARKTWTCELTRSLSNKEGGISLASKKQLAVKVMIRVERSVESPGLLALGGTDVVPRKEKKGPTSSRAASLVKKNVKKPQALTPYHWRRISNGSRQNCWWDKACRRLGRSNQ